MKTIIKKPDFIEYFTLEDFTVETKNGMIFLHKLNINMFSVCFGIKELEQIIPFLQQAMENAKRGESWQSAKIAGNNTNKST